MENENLTQEQIDFIVNDVKSIYPNLEKSILEWLNRSLSHFKRSAKAIYHPWAWEGPETLFSYDEAEITFGFRRERDPIILFYEDGAIGIVFEEVTQDFLGVLLNSDVEFERYRMDAMLDYFKRQGRSPFVNKKNLLYDGM